MRGAHVQFYTIKAWLSTLVFNVGVLTTIEAQKCINTSAKTKRNSSSKRTRKRTIESENRETIQNKRNRNEFEKVDVRILLDDHLGNHHVGQSCKRCCSCDKNKNCDNNYDYNYTPTKRWQSFNAN